MKILRVMLAAVLFVACVFVATANMHVVTIVLPQAPIQGWPLVRELQAPLFVVILAALVIGVLVTGLATLLEQVRLRATARRARKERERAMAALEPAETARDAALQDQVKLRDELRQAGIGLDRMRQERDDALRTVEELRTGIAGSSVRQAAPASPDKEA